MSDGIVPAIEFADAAVEGATAFGRAPANSSVLRKRRTLDLRRTETPGLGEMPVVQQKHQGPRRYAVVTLDPDGRVTDQRLFSQLGWTRETRVDIGVGDGHEIVVRRDDQGTSRLTARNMVLIPAQLRQWCDYDAGDQVLVVAVPSMSAVVLHKLAALDQALPDPRRIVQRMRPPGAPAGDAAAAEDGGDGELSAGSSGSHHGNGARGTAGPDDGRE